MTPTDGPLRVVLRAVQTPVRFPSIKTPLLRQWGLGRGWYLTRRRIAGWELGFRVSLYRIGGGRSFDLELQLLKWRFELGRVTTASTAT